MKKQFKKGHKRERQPKEFEEEVIQIDRVTRVVKGGRKLRFRATVAIGNKKGKVGIGVGKSHEVTGAIQKAIAKAKKTLCEVVLDGTTIPHDYKVKYKSSKITFLPAAPGTGIIAGGPIRKILDLAGVHDILSKSYGTTNKISNSRATFMALKNMKETPLMKRKKAAEKKVAPKQTDDNAKKEDNQKKAAPKKTEAKKPEPKKTEENPKSSK